MNRMENKPYIKHIGEIKNYLKNLKFNYGESLMSKMENKPYIKHIGEIKIILTILYLFLWKVEPYMFEIKLYLFYGKSNPIFLEGPV